MAYSTPPKTPAEALRAFADELDSGYWPQTLSKEVLQIELRGRAKEFDQADRITNDFTHVTKRLMNEKKEETNV